MKALTSSRQSQRGLTLLESLIALVVAAVGVLAVVAMQLRTLSDAQNSVRRSQAIGLIESLSEQMQANPNALYLLDDYVIGWGTAEGSPALTPQADKLCDDQACTAAELAAYDIREWKRLVETSLPSGDANVFLAPGESVTGNRRQLGVMIRWRENDNRGQNPADRQQFSDEIDLTKQLVSTGGTRSFVDLGGDVQCNDDADDPQYICHLQYLSVASRCAVHTGGSAPLYFCAGS